MRHLELFAGIGGFRRAMDILTNDHIMEFHCIGYSLICQYAHITLFVGIAEVLPNQYENIFARIFITFLRYQQPYNRRLPLL